QSKDTVTLGGTGGTTITNLKAGDVSANSTDAVNGSQLFSTNQNVQQNTANIATNTANITANTNNIATNTANITANTADIGALQNQTWKLQANGDTASAVKSSDTVQFIDGNNIAIARTGNDITVSTKADVNFDKVTVGGVVIDKASNKITGLAKGDVSATSTDAVNGSQLQELKDAQTASDNSAVKYDDAQSKDTVTLGGTGGTTITNLKAGDVSSTSTDAVNGSQLNAQGEAVKNIIGGTTIYNPTTGTLSNTNIGGTGASTIDEAIKSVSTTAKASKTEVKQGNNILVTEVEGDDGQTIYTVSTDKNVKFDSVEIADTRIDQNGVSFGSAVNLNNTGLTITNGPSVTVSGINAGNKTITNVAAGVNSTDAVNKGQLDSAINNINNKVDQVNENAIQYDKNPDGTLNKNSVTLAGGTGGTTITNVADGQVSQNSKDAVNGGQLWAVEQKVDQNANDISNIKNEINNGSIGLVNQETPTSTVTVAKDTGGKTVNVAGTEGERVVTGVAAGQISAESKDAINGAQLNATNQAMVQYLGGGAGYNNITQSFDAPNYEINGSSYNNVGDALGALNQADQALGNRITNLGDQLQQAFYSTNKRIDDVEKKANAGIAAAMALENAPYIPGKYTYAAGAAYHGGENAIGVTLRKTADNGRWSITGGVAAASEGDASVRVGISGVIN
ncbi:MAG: YadA-like family protein, partial [Acinetobacter amyesii]|uniref:YadA-like family protein n=1 Tax=Acinetobacter amyesii TaxID=2942470 RepID=UPI003D05A69F